MNVERLRWNNEKYQLSYEALDINNNLTKNNNDIQKVTLKCSQSEKGKIKHISIAKQESKTHNDKNEKQ